MTHHSSIQIMPSSAQGLVSTLVPVA